VVASTGQVHGGFESGGFSGRDVAKRAADVEFDGFEASLVAVNGFGKVGSAATFARHSVRIVSTASIGAFDAAIIWLV